MSKFYPLAHDSWDERELDALQEVIKSRQFTMGPKVAEFETAIAKFHNRKHAVMVNSGSSANLLMIAALIFTGDLKRGDEVIVPAVSWSTTYTPLQQYGLVPLFVDVDAFGNIEYEDVEAYIIGEKVKAVFAVNLLGFAADLPRLKTLCADNDVILLEDNCESFGAKTYYDNDKLTGTYGKMASLSFFFSHHLSTMEGGMILTDDPYLADILRSLRAHGWTRDLKGTDLYHPTGIPFEDNFKFVTPGYCVRPLEFSAAVGLVQLEKWPELHKARLKNAKVFTDLFKDRETVLIPMYEENSTWFGFPMLVDSGKTRRQLIQICEWKGIDTRPIVAGNFLNQPVIRYFEQIYETGSYRNAERIDKCGLFFGNDNRDLEPQLMQLRLFV